jgi:hypothetical protein
MQKPHCTDMLPSFALQKVAENAFAMDTTLWFSQKDNEGAEGLKKPSIIACGQFTTCFNLLDYICKLKTAYGNSRPVFDNFSPKDQQLINQFQARLETDFKRFCTDPFWLYNELGLQYQIENFKPVAAADVSIPKKFKNLR